MTVSNVVHVRDARLNPVGVISRLQELAKKDDVHDVLVMSLHGRFVGLIEPYHEDDHAGWLTDTEVLTLPDAVGRVYGRDGTEALKLHARVEGTDVLVTLLSSQGSSDLQRRALKAYLDANPLPEPGTEKFMSSEEVRKELGLED